MLLTSRGLKRQDQSNVVNPIPENVHVITTLNQSECRKRIHDSKKTIQDLRLIGREEFSGPVTERSEEKGKLDIQFSTAVKLH